MKLKSVRFRLRFVNLRHRLGERGGSELAAEASSRAERALPGVQGLAPGKRPVSLRSGGFSCNEKTACSSAPDALTKAGYGGFDKPRNCRTEEERRGCIELLET